MDCIYLSVALISFVMAFGKGLMFSFSSCSVKYSCRKKNNILSIFHLFSNSISSFHRAQLMNASLLFFWVFYSAKLKKNIAMISDGREKQNVWDIKILKDSWGSISMNSPVESQLPPLWNSCLTPEQDLQGHNKLSRNSGKFCQFQDLCRI